MRKKNRVSPEIPTVREGWEATARSTADGEPGLSSNEHLPVNLGEETAITTTHCDTLNPECVTRRTDVRGSKRYNRYSSWIQKTRISESEQEGS